MAALKTPSDPSPHVDNRLVDGAPEAYIPGTGLAIWEIAWLGRAYQGDAASIALHIGAERDLIEEGLSYAAQHPSEVDAEIAFHTERSLSELLELYPDMRVLDVDIGELDEMPD